MRRPEQGSTTLTALAISVGLLLPPNVIRAQGITRPEGRHPESPSFIGTGGTRLYRVGPMEFQPDDSAATAFNTLFSPGFGRYTTQGGNLYAMPHLPSGALVTGVELDYCDTNPGDFHPQLQVSSASYNGTGLTPLGIVSGTGINGCGLAFLDLTNKNFAVDNNQNELILQAQLGASDGSEAIAGAIVHYKLQVSPAPATATFGDVPTSYIYFRTIEARSIGRHVRLRRRELLPEPIGDTRRDGEVLSRRSGARVRVKHAVIAGLALRAGDAVSF